MTHRACPTTPRTSSGFTLMETMIALLIMGFLMLGSMDMYINSLRMASRSTAEVFASQDAAVAMRSIEDQVRESLWLALPNSGDAEDPDNSNELYFTEQLANFPSLSGYTTSNFIATDPTDTYTSDTGMFLAYPTVNNTPTFNTSSALATNGQSTTFPYNMYNRSSPNSGGLMIYRSDANGTPDPTVGEYLWEVSSGSNPTIDQPLIRSVDTTTWNAVQFERPLNGDVAYDWEVEVKITSGYYSAINGQQTNEATNGTSTTQLVGRCVAMRDHAPGNDPHKPDNPTGTTTDGNKYQATTENGLQAG